MRKAQIASVIAFAFFSLVGGCLVFALDGFTTTGKHSSWSVFVPTPQAYVMAAIMFAQSIVGVLWLLQQIKAPPLGYVAATAAYGGLALGLTKALAAYFQ